MAILVNGERIDDSEIQREAERLRPQYEQKFADMEPQDRETQLLEWSRENVIERYLIHQDAMGNGNGVTSEEIDSALARIKEQFTDQQQLYKEFDAKNDDDVKRTIELQIRIDRRLRDVCKDLPDPSDQAIQAYYKRHKDDFKTDERIRVAHIVKYVNWQCDEAAALETINQAHEELKTGLPFEAAVDKFTDCADSGGDLGYIMRSQMVEEFDDVVFNLDVGQVSDIFRTRFGFHIAKVYDRKPPTVPDLKFVKPRISEILKRRMEEDAINQFIDELRAKAAIAEL